MDSLSSFSRSLTRHLFSAALVALPLAILAFAGCSGDVQQDTGSSSTGAVDGSSCSRSGGCASGAVCVLPPNACEADAKGSCQSLFQCDGPPSGPVCGCDGKVVEGEYPDCVPELASNSYQDSVACQTGTFACGPTLTCKRNSEVCVEKVPGAPGPSSYECAAFATVRGWCQHEIPDCNCLDATKLGDLASTMCKADADHQETITVKAP
jgi:hypothetical protein